MNLDYTKNFREKEFEIYTSFHHQKGIKEIPRFNKNKIKNFIKSKKETQYKLDEKNERVVDVEKNKSNQEYLAGLKLEFKSLKSKLLYSDIYLIFKKLENKHYNLVDYLLDLSLNK